MPPKSRRTVRSRSGYSIWHCFQLCTGYDWFGEAWGKNPDPAGIAEGWQDLGEDLLQLHISHFATTRPWAWWQTAAPERRQRVDGKAHPFDNGSTPAHLRLLYYGQPRMLATTDDLEAVYECSCAYLARLQLLTKQERLLVATDDWQCAEETREEPGPPGLTLDAIKTWYAAQTA